MRGYLMPGLLAASEMSAGIVVFHVNQNESLGDSDLVYGIENILKTFINVIVIHKVLFEL